MNKIITPNRSRMPSRPQTASFTMIKQLSQTSTSFMKHPGRNISSSQMKKRVKAQVQQQNGKRPASRLQANTMHIRSVSNSKPLRAAPASKQAREMLLFKEVFIEPRLEGSKLLSPGKKHKQFKEITDEIDVHSKTFFNLMIQVQPPEGPNSTVIAPLAPGGGWAPSIPARASWQVPLQDLRMRAQAGVQPGDIQREAHMAFSLGTVNESMGSYKQSCRFFKRFFFCARLLEDPIGATLALNRLGNIYHLLKKHQKSLKFHLKHSEYAENDNQFTAFYNLGIAYRSLQDYENSVDKFTQALKLAVVKGDLESESITVGQLGITHLETSDLEKAKLYLEKSMHTASRLKNLKIVLDSLLVLGTVAYKEEDWEAAINYYKEAIAPAKLLGENDAVDRAHCSIGIAMTNLKMKNTKASILKRCYNASNA